MYILCFLKNGLADSDLLSNIPRIHLSRLNFICIDLFKTELECTLQQGNNTKILQFKKEITSNSNNTKMFLKILKNKKNNF